MEQLPTSGRPSAEMVRGMEEIRPPPAMIMGRIDAADRLHRTIPATQPLRQTSNISHPTTKEPPNRRASFDRPRRMEQLRQAPTMIMGRIDSADLNATNPVHQIIPGSPPVFPTANHRSPPAREELPLGRPSIETAGEFEAIAPGPPVIMGGRINGVDKTTPPILHKLAVRVPFVIAFLIFVSLAILAFAAPGRKNKADISQLWGQYSPYSVSSISDKLPPQCDVTFAQILSRHGARYPTYDKSLAYKITIQELNSNVTSFHGKYNFLADYHYTLLAENLTDFSQEQMSNSGIEFYHRYQHLARNVPFFVRATSGERVLQSAKNFTRGFDQARRTYRSRLEVDSGYPKVTISEEPGSNNALNHGLCTTLENRTANIAKLNWLDIFMPPIRDRLNKDLPGANLNITQTLYMMDLCPLNTVASPTGALSPFCGLFSEREWRQYSYYQSLDKYHGYGPGTALDPTQGVGFANELVARMTGKPVVDRKSTNRTLDSDNATFPVGAHHGLFADFTHDNEVTAIFFALGIYEDKPLLSNRTVQDEIETCGYSAAWTVPFAARAYIEKMNCRGRKGNEEWVRVILNDRVVPLRGCGGDGECLGRCRFSTWVASLCFARGGGRWDECFTSASEFEGLLMVNEP